MTCECDCVLHTDDVPLCDIPASWDRCECVQCAGGRCRILVSPLNKFVVEVEAVRQSGSCESNDMVPTFCEDCRENYLLDLRRKAVKRAREKRKDEEVRQHERQALE